MFILLFSIITFTAPQVSSNNTNTNNATIPKPVHKKKEEEAKKGKPYSLHCVVAPRTGNPVIEWSAEKTKIDMSKSSSSVLVWYIVNWRIIHLQFYGNAEYRKYFLEMFFYLALFFVYVFNLFSNISIAFTFVLARGLPFFCLLFTTPFNWLVEIEKEQ